MRDESNLTTTCPRCKKQTFTDRDGCDCAEVGFFIMNKTEIETAIAESMGLKIKNFKPWNEPTQKAYQDENGRYHKMPSYTEDLNAMHEIEDAMPDHMFATYRNNLIKIAGGHRDGSSVKTRYWRSTAAQRAEAYLKTIDKQPNQ